MAALPKMGTLPGHGSDPQVVQDLGQAGPESTTFDVNLSRRWVPWFLFSEQWSSLAVETSPWAMQILLRWFWLMCFVPVLRAGCCGSRPVLSVWESDVQSWLDQM